MNRKKFIESHGATCENWTWSWSFVNHSEKFVIFGAWDVYDEDGRVLILHEDWARSERGRRQPGYPQSREHVRLVEEEGYRLKTFPMEYEKAYVDDIASPAKIKGFTPVLHDRGLLRIDSGWYASDDLVAGRSAEEADPSDVFWEGAVSSVKVNKYERNAQARKACLNHYGHECVVCKFDFEQFYGPLGRRYIHVHHIVPLSEIRKKYKLDPVRDLVPICPNCHAEPPRLSWRLFGLSHAVSATS
jgi:5-methylcytosine-specific restriction protein A